jgi:hypothetical protein
MSCFTTQCHGWDLASGLHIVLLHHVFAVTWHDMIGAGTWHLVAGTAVCLMATLFISGNPNYPNFQLGQQDLCD